jgi:protein-S-isoprenylcysteine O-methyltransferase Ste14
MQRRGEKTVSKAQRIFIDDLLGRACIVAYFTYAAAAKIVALRAAWIEWQTLTLENKELWVLSNLSNVLFLLLVVVTTIFRLKPINTAGGVEPRITALAGTFLLGLLVLVPEQAPLPPSLAAFALVLVIVGFGLSTYVLHWLGKSFSIMAEARQLVTRGPYSFVRHPLYLTEEIAVVGIIVLNFSPLALLIGITHWCLQLRRMHNEECVLNATFPDYSRYAAMTPKVIPHISSRFGKSRSHVG